MSLSNFEIRTLCHCFGVFGEAVASLISSQRALLDRGRLSSGTSSRVKIFDREFGLEFVFVPEGLQQLAGG